MSVYELAGLYYPRLWDKFRIEALVKAGRLSEAEEAQITGEGIPEGGRDGNESE